jgi:phosphotriesterase-related protein
MDSGSDTVWTARGPISTQALGRTLMHEHIFVVDAEYALNSYTDEQVRSLIDDAVESLDALQAAGIDSIVDCTVLGIGRMTPWLKEVARRTRLNIVLATGAYVTGDLLRLFSLRGPGTPLGGDEPMTELFIRELTDGIGDTGIRAGVVKCATDVAGLTASVERVVRAVGHAAAATGAAVLTHTDAPTRQGLAQQRVLAECGVDLSRVVIGHCSDTGDLDYLTTLLERGSCIGMDRFKWSQGRTFDERTSTVAELCRRGFADRIVLSEDASCFHAWMDSDAVAELAPGSTAAVIPNEVVPALLAKGVPPDDIEQMLVRNPRRLLATPTGRVVPADHMLEASPPRRTGRG